MAKTTVHIRLNIALSEHLLKTLDDIFIGKGFEKASTYRLLRSGHGIEERIEPLTSFPDWCRVISIAYYAVDNNESVVDVQICIEPDGMVTVLGVQTNIQGPGCSQFTEAEMHVASALQSACIELHQRLGATDTHAFSSEDLGGEDETWFHFSKNEWRMFDPPSLDDEN